MDVGTALSAVQTLFAALQCNELRELWSSLGHKTELAKIQKTVSTVKAVLKDAETKQGLSNEQQVYIEELKEAVFEADDVFDRCVTLSKRKRLVMEDGKLSEKVRLLLSRLNQKLLGKMLKRVNNVRSKLEDIASNHRNFGFVDVNNDPSSKYSKYKREESSSRIHAFDLIGREDDVEKIVSVLLNPVVEEDVSFFSVVGMGGLGKTALSQFVFNDERVSSAFSLKLWTCVSDHGQDQLDIASVLAKILESVTGRKPHSESSLDNVQKFLLVLDDVWNESRNDWIKLAGYLTGGQRGSWVLTTTRSKETARVIGNGLRHELQGLSEENSWKLFKRMAFGHGKTIPDEFIQIGQDIVKSCGDVPLVIRMIGSRLYGISKAKWVSFQQKELAHARSLEEYGIMPLLRALP
ncbi:putative disease resistance protein RGA4 [Silene latifolia]|uniref:putative disease resistance protein RGA4 n=1 Tax=Silene latifolia TaxID=37657 RepID=UPI003D773EAA